MKKPLKDPVLGWLCIRCYDNRSHKNNHFINAVTLKCSNESGKANNDMHIYVLGDDNKIELTDYDNESTEIKRLPTIRKLSNKYKSFKLKS